MPAALLFGSAAGVGYALQAAVTKRFLTVVGRGAGAVLSSWTNYVLIGSALLGFVPQQSALKTGILAPAIGSSNAVTLLFNAVLGAGLFDERLSQGGDRSGPAVIGLLLTVAGIALLAKAEPPQRSQPPELERRA